MNDSNFTHFGTYPSLPDIGGHIFNSQPEDTLPGTYSDEYWLSESPPSPTSSSCSSSSSATSLKAVDKILTNITGSHPPVPLINDVEQINVKNLQTSTDLDALLSKMVEERLNDPSTDLVLEHSTSELNEAAISPVVSSNHLLSPYLCGTDNSFMDDGDDQGCSFMEAEDEEDGVDHVHGKYAPSQDDGTLLREYAMDQEDLIDDGIVTLTSDVEQLLDNIFQDNFHESAAVDYGDEEMDQ